MRGLTFIGLLGVLTQGCGAKADNETATAASMDAGTEPESGDAPREAGTHSDTAAAPTEEASSQTDDASAPLQDASPGNPAGPGEPMAVEGQRPITQDPTPATLTDAGTEQDPRDPPLDPEQDPVAPNPEPPEGSQPEPELELPDDLAQPALDCSAGIAPTPAYRPLTQQQYENTIHDLLGVELDMTGLLPTVQSDDIPAVDDYLPAAEFVVSVASLDSLLPCSVDSAECVDEFIHDFGLRAFRRPLTEPEAADYLALYETLDGNSFGQAIELIVTEMLASPHFVSRPELSTAQEGDYFVLSDYELASRLSYLLWGTMPDAELMATAQSGDLGTQEQLLAQTQRMLNDPKARPQLRAFHEAYAGMTANPRWADFTKDATLYPAFGATLIPTMQEETALVFDTIATEGGSFEDLLLTSVGYVNAELAPIYGLDPTSFGVELTRVELGNHRPGVFTRALFLSAFAYPDRTSPIRRGAFLLDEVLCLSVGASVEVQETLPVSEELVTVRDQVEALTASAACAGCHQPYIDPLGFALEGFDAVGSIQQVDNGAPINTAATIPLTLDTHLEVDGAPQLMYALANSPAAQQCYARKLVEFAYERPPNEYDACTVNLLAERVADGGTPILELFAALTQTNAFRLRAPLP